MIHSLVCKKLALWLGSTVDLWAGDVLEIAKLGAEEKKVTLPAGYRRLFPILEHDHKPTIWLVTEASTVSVTKGAWKLPT